MAEILSLFYDNQVLSVTSFYKLQSVMSIFNIYRLLETVNKISSSTNLV